MSDSASKESGWHQDVAVLREVYRRYFGKGAAIYQQGSIQELISCLYNMGYTLDVAFIIPAKILLEIKGAQPSELASQPSLLAFPEVHDPVLAEALAATSARSPRGGGGGGRRRPLDEPSFLEFLGSLESVGRPGHNTDAWRSIFRRTPVPFPGKPLPILPRSPPLAPTTTAFPITLLTRSLKPKICVFALRLIFDVAEPA